MTPYLVPQDIPICQRDFFQWHILLALSTCMAAFSDFNFDIGMFWRQLHPSNKPSIPTHSPWFFSPLPRKASQPPASTARPLGSPKAQTNYAQTKRHRPTARSVSSKISKTPLEVLSCEISWYKKAPEKKAPRKRLTSLKHLLGGVGTISEQWPARKLLGFCWNGSFFLLLKWQNLQNLRNVNVKSQCCQYHLATLIPRK